jgi:lysine-ketoglutarate reductase/saccharopine dehydrogenase-like protein (TIGR00300 family)
MSESLPRVLMCEPKFFGVEYVINPWMEGHIGRVRPQVARRQWEQLHQHVSRVAQVELVEPAKGLPDMVFTANAGTVLEDAFIPAVFRVPQRAPEVPLFTDWFRGQGFRIQPLPDHEAYEGEGDGLFQPGAGGGVAPRLWGGYGVRSSLESHATLTRLLGAEVVSLRLIDERFYHLDTCFVPLPEGRVMYYPAAFDEWSLRTIEQLVPADRRLVVEDADAMLFACNAVRLGRTLIMNHAGPTMRRRLGEWGYEVITTPLDEFMLAGGAAKCLCLLLQQEVTPAPARKRKAITSPVRDTLLELQGHLLDTGLMNRVLDKVTDAGGGFRVESFSAGERHDQHSIARIRVAAPSAERLDMIVTELLPMGVRQMAKATDARLETVDKDGVAPDDFYSTTIYPTDVRVKGKWVRVTGQRMDVMIVVDEEGARCTLMRDLKRGEKVVCGVNGVRVHTPDARKSDGEFAFMSAGVSSERRVETAVDQLAWDMQRIRRRGGKIVVVAGPVVVHTGGVPHLSNLIRHGYVQVLLTGNALPAHDIEFNLYGTSLGVDLKRGVGVPHGHQHHLRAINKVRRAGSVAAAVEQGIITAGVMFECVKHGVEYVLAGSIRDDGPLPDTIMDLEKAQAAYARAIEGADMILMLSSMLHAIGTGNMTPAGVRLVCVDISPAVVTKLADRGSVESTGIVTDVGLLLNLLARRLCTEEAIPTDAEAME